MPCVRPRDPGEGQCLKSRHRAWEAAGASRPEAQAVVPRTVSPPQPTVGTWRLAPFKLAGGNRRVSINGPAQRASSSPWHRAVRPRPGPTPGCVPSPSGGLLRRRTAWLSERFDVLAGMTLARAGRGRESETPLSRATIAHLWGFKLTRSWGQCHVPLPSLKSCHTVSQSCPRASEQRRWSVGCCIVRIIRPGASSARRSLSRPSCPPASLWERFASRSGDPAFAPACPT